MKVLKNLVAIVGVAFCVMSCSQHTTCAAYASTNQIKEAPSELNVGSIERNVEWM